MDKIISRFENTNTPFIYYIFTFLCVITLRSFFEDMSQFGLSYFDQPTEPIIYNTLHFFVSYTSGAISLTLLCYAFFRIEIAKIIKIVLSGFVILLSAPLIDLLFYMGQSRMVTYMYLGMVPSDSLFSLFITFFSHYPGRVRLLMLSIG